ncbi:MAG: gliding motility-associated C-terminal domain-containing protein [Chitinophagaceae bacterium]|nr:gliding motility-associated C-terminal domain-containing protein [Chitinophagaceae bacterium]
MCKGPAVFAYVLFSVLIIGFGRIYAQPYSASDVPSGFACPTITSVTTVDADCAGMGAIVTVNATGGTAPLKYSIDGVLFQNSNVFTNVPVGVFTVYVKDATPCQVKSNGEIFKRCLQLTADATDPGCSNGDGAITAVASDGFPSYIYSIDGINFQSSPDFPNLTAGNYRIYVTDARGQSSSYPVTLQRICLGATVTPGDATCGQDNGTLDVTAFDGYVPFTYSIDGINFQTDPHFGGLAPGPYTVTVHDQKGNSTTANATINGLPGPTLTATPGAPATCINNDGVVVINGTSGPAPYQYALDGGNYTANGTIDHVSSGNHQAHVKDANGCIASQTVTVPLNDNLTVDGGPDFPVCQGSSGVIQATSNGTSFSWQPATGLNNSHLLQPTVTPAAATTYTLTATLGICQKTASMGVTINPAPTASAGPGGNICYGQSLQLQGSGQGSGSLSYSWIPAAHLDNPSIANPTVSGLTQTTTYQLTVTDAKGCSSLNTSYVTVTITPPPRVFAGNDTSVLLGQPVPLHAVDVDNVGLGGWVWNPSDGLNNDVIRDPIARPQQSITYTATGYTFNGCAGSAGITVTVYTVSGVFVPNAFTPNGDGHNDVLRPVLVGIKELKYFAVFDRWGQRIFYTTNPTEGWRGYSNGKDQPMGTYVWMVGGIDYKGALIQQKGTVLLIR